MPRPNNRLHGLSHPPITCRRLPLTNHNISSRLPLTSLNTSSRPLLTRLDSVDSSRQLPLIIIRLDCSGILPLSTRTLPITKPLFHMITRLVIRILTGPGISPNFRLTGPLTIALTSRRRNLTSLFRSLAPISRYLLRDSRRLNLISSIRCLAPISRNLPSRRHCALLVSEYALPTSGCPLQTNLWFLRKSRSPI